MKQIVSFCFVRFIIGYGFELFIGYGMKQFTGYGMKQKENRNKNL